MASLIDLFQSGNLPQGGAPPAMDEDALRAVLERLFAQSPKTIGPGTVQEGAPAPMPMVPQAPWDTTVTRDIAPTPAYGAPYAPGRPEADGGGAGSPKVSGISPPPAAAPPPAASRPEFEPYGGERFQHGGLIGMVGSALGIKGPLDRDALARNQTYAALAPKIGHEMAAAAVSNPQLLPAALKQAFPEKFGTVKQGDLLYGMDLGPDGKPQARELLRNEPKDQVVAPGAAITRDGKPIFINQPRVEPGYRLKDANNPALGTEPIPGGSKDQAFTEKKHKALTSLESIEANSDTLLNNIKGVRDHPGLPGNFGVTGVFPNYWGGDAANAKTRLDQLKSQGAFNMLQAMRDASKTGGALGNVSNQEGARLEAAFAALQTAQSVESARDELNKASKIVADYKKRARTAYEREYETSTPDALPSRSAPRDGWRDLGNGVRIRPKN